MASMKAIKTRIKSVESTRQITKAMELVATSKLRRAKERAERTRPYHEVLAQAISGLQAALPDKPSPFTQQRPVQKTCYVIIGGDRGLAGGYNANLFRMAAEAMQEGACCVLPVGKKTLEHFARRKYEIVSTYFGVTGSLGIGDCAQIAKLLCEGYADGRFERVVVLYTEFRSMLSQVPVSETLLPITIDAGGRQVGGALLEGDPAELVGRIVPLYVSGMLYSAVCEASASEQGARRTAMNAANKNADEIIDTLTLHYNRARQAVITREITEIVSGAEAL